MLATLSLPKAEGVEVAIIAQRPRLALKTLTVSTATHGVDANATAPSATSVNIVTKTLPRGSHAERLLREAWTQKTGPL